MSTLMDTREDRHIFMTLGSRSTAEIIGGFVAMILAILGLINIAPIMMLAIATLAVAIAFVFEGGTIAAEFSHLRPRTSNNTFQTIEMGSGMTAEMVAGLAGIVLGVLALLGIYSTILTASAVIVYGAALTLSSGMMLRLNNLEAEDSEVHQRTSKLTHEAVTMAVSAQVLIGLSAGILGILALVGLAANILVLVALLAIGTALLLSGSAVGGRLISLFRR